jgi:hypothetical protein
LHPSKVPEDYDLEDGDKIDLAIFVPTSDVLQKSKVSPNNKITSYFAKNASNPSGPTQTLTDGDEGKNH